MLVGALEHPCFGVDAECCGEDYDARKKIATSANMSFERFAMPFIQSVLSAGYESESR